jgi:hypothetical protein
VNAYIFVSYSRHDEEFITQIVHLLRTTIAGIPSVAGNTWEFVFQDKDHLSPGTPWREQIDAAIAQAERIFVFWCKHAAASDQVRREYELAVSLGRVVIPVLVDDTALPDALKSIHGVNLRDLSIHGPRIRNFSPQRGLRTPEEVILERFASVLDFDARFLLGRLPKM